jgi:hypothetical protein
MAWNLEGRYFENCSCDMPCPCTVTFDAGADLDRCNALLVFHVDSGEVDGVDVGGVTVAAVVDAPKVMTDGNWRLGVLVDDRATDQQVEKLLAVFGGQMGGPMEALGPLVGEQLGVERLRMDVVEEDGRHVLRAGDGVEVEIEDVVPFGREDGRTATLDGVFHPAGETLTIARTRGARWNLFGIDVEHGSRTSAFSAPFTWSG